MPQTIINYDSLLQCMPQIVHDYLLHHSFFSALSHIIIHHYQVHRSTNVCLIVLDLLKTYASITLREENYAYEEEHPLIKN